MAEWQRDPAVQRKAFRIEAMLAPRLSATPSHTPGADDERTTALSGLRRELAVVQNAIARNRKDLSALVGDGKDRQFARAAAELGAAVDDMRAATNQILSLAETADDNARALAASLKDDYKRGLAQEIQDQIVKVYEACNFQDITGQHIGKVIRMLAAMEHQLESILARCNGAHAAAQPLAIATGDDDGLLNGPKLAGDDGHATQQDIDRIFG